MYRRLTLMALALTLSSFAATLQQLTLDDMIAKSTDIVRGKVSAQSAAFRALPGRSGMIYTHYVIDVSERYKAGAAHMDVAVPGGTVQGYRHMFAGAPALKVGDEFVFFLWTSKSGLTQIIGLTQGLFSLGADLSGKVTASRAASSEPMLDSSGNPVTDGGMKLTLADLKTRIAAVLGRADQ